MSSELSSWLLNLTPIMSFVVIVLYIFRKPIGSKINEIKIQRKKNSDEIKTLIYHDIFNVISNVRKEVKRTKFETEGTYDEAKTLMFRDFMEFKLLCIYGGYKTYLKGLKKDVKSDALKTSMLKMINSLVEDYTEQTYTHFLRKGIPSSDADYVIELFEKWRFETIKSLSNRINGIFASDFHSGAFEQLLACLEVTSMAIELIPKDGIASFDEMNGRFLKLKY